MIVDILQENLLKALTRTGRIVSPHPQLPITQNVLLVAEKGGLRLTTSNLETSESVWVGAKTEKEGGICVSSKIITEFVSSLPPDTVCLRLQDGALSISCLGFNATIPGVPASEFPPAPAVEGKGGLALGREMILTTLQQVLFAAATDEGRPLLTGIRIKSDEGGATLAATDGYRLSVKKILLSVKEPLDMVAPARALSEAAKVLQEEKEEKEMVFVKTKDGQLALGVGDTQIVTRLIDGEYPNFEKIIPKTFTSRALLDKEKINRAVRSAAIFARDSANIVRFRLDNQKITVSANAPQVGENRIEIQTKIDGEGGDMAFNSRFLLEFFANFPEPEIIFEMTGSLNPGVFRPVKDESHLHIIMPVRTQG